MKLTWFGGTTFGGNTLGGGAQVVSGGGVAGAGAVVVAGRESRFFGRATSIEPRSNFKSDPER